MKRGEEGWMGGGGGAWYNLCRVVLPPPPRLDRCCATDTFLRGLCTTLPCLPLLNCAVLSSLSCVVHVPYTLECADHVPVLGGHCCPCKRQRPHACGGPTGPLLQRGSPAGPSRVALHGHPVWLLPRCDCDPGWTRGPLGGGCTPRCLGSFGFARLAVAHYHLGLLSAGVCVRLCMPAF